MACALCLNEASWVLQVSETGKVLQVLMDPNASHIGATSAVVETDEHLYIGNLAGAYVSVFPKEKLPPVQT